MKKAVTIIMAALILAGMTAAYAAEPGSASDPLVTLGYLNGSYRQTLVAEGRAEIDKALGAVYDEAVKGLAQDGADTGYSFAAGLTELALQTGNTVRLITGSSFILTGGAASLNISKGSVINVSTGNVVSSGSMLAVNQRYLCAEDTEAVVTAASGAVGQVDGYYITDGVPVLTHSVFKDVKTSDWFYAAVDYGYGGKLFTGTEADKFSPGTSMMRGMFVTVLYRLDGTPAVADAGEFLDVADPSQYYYGAVGWANSSEVVTGYSDGTFRPSGLITREQMAVIMYRYAAYKGEDTSVTDTSAYDAFPDTGAVSAYAADAMRWAVSRGIINGSEGRLLPGNTATRAQVAQIIFNFCEQILTVPQ
jgi:hypothetical protein